MRPWTFLIQGPKLNLNSVTQPGNNASVSFQPLLPQPAKFKRAHCPSMRSLNALIFEFSACEKLKTRAFELSERPCKPLPNPAVGIKKYSGSGQGRKVPFLIKSTPPRRQGTENVLLVRLERVLLRPVVPGADEEEIPQKVPFASVLSKKESCIRISQVRYEVCSIMALISRIGTWT